MGWMVGQDFAGALNLTDGAGEVKAKIENE